MILTDTNVVEKIEKIQKAITATLMFRFMTM